MIILDTNVLSELMRPRPSPNVVNWVESRPESELFTTSIAEAEIYLGIELLAKGKRRDQLLAAADAIFAEDLAGRILGFEGDAARAFARIVAGRRLAGRPIGHADAQTVAIAQVQRAAVATRNVGDFAGCDIEVVDPWRVLSP